MLSFFQSLEENIPQSYTLTHFTHSNIRYKRILLKDCSLLERLGQNKDEQKNEEDEDLDVVGREAGNDWAKLQSLMMQLRKVCNHPFLFPNAEAAVEASFSSGAWKGQCTETIVTSSGKMEMLDRLLRRLKSKGHRVVIFSQFTQMLDIIDDFLVMRGYQFARLDGSTNRVQRYVDIHEFNKENSPYFCFIMSTRAGGMGINLQTADTVILMDSDWNPQVDLQAMARVHRIGQTKTVHVYRLVSSGTWCVRALNIVYSTSVRNEKLNSRARTQVPWRNVSYNVLRRNCFWMLW